MLCPNCSETLQSMIIHNQTVLHCPVCSGNFFEENGINRITLEDAQELTRNGKASIYKSGPKICPKDNIFMQAVQNDEAVPKNVVLYKCPKCRGIFAQSDDLLTFKRAQDVKIEFFKMWQNPLPSLKAVLVLGIVAIIGVTIFQTYLNKSIRSTSAEGLVTSTTFNQSGRYLLVSFKTETPFVSSILIEDINKKTATIETISKEATTFHYAVLTNITTTDSLTYQIILRDDKGKEYKTEKKILKIQQ